MASNMDSTGTLETAKIMSEKKLFTCAHKYISYDDWKIFHTNNPQLFEYIAISCGTSSQDLQNLHKILDLTQCMNICLDVANGYTEIFVDTIRKLREIYPNHTIIAGNVVTCEMTEELLLSGADIVKVGIGPGSVCTTRKMTGVGYPQLSAVIECADAAHGLGGHIISDGGCTSSGDISKAFGAGSDFVMLGGMLSGHDESGGELYSFNNKQYKLFYGMSSKIAMDRYMGGVADYRASEGKVVVIPYKGDLESTIKQILGGVRSTCTYVGASTLKELSKRTTFLRVTQQINDTYTSLETETAELLMKERLL
uniref:GMP reductase n=1 Tax=Henneguya salminicola TaxID=69463 RepID=A0A6G3MFN6_HENSL